MARAPFSEPSPEQRYAAERRRRKGEAAPRDRGRAEADGSTHEAEERAVLVGIGSEPDDAGHLSMLDELAELARTAGARILGRLYQRRVAPHPATYLGKGKLAELVELVEETEATLVITDSDLTPAQVRRMEDAVDVKVIDRSELIIDIFALGARTRQARLQVELAQLRYLAPRLKRMWTHLSRITGQGGIGSRGPGEKQIEVDRRIIQKRIAELQSELREIEGRRERQVGARHAGFNVALVGYTNAGKSTLMRALTGSEVYVADQLFATLDTRTRRWEFDGEEVLLSDTVGFIQKLPHHLVASFHATLEEVREADLLLHVVDAGDPDAEHRIKVVRDVLERVDAAHVPEILVLNKVDLLPDPMEVTILSRRLGSDVAVSAIRREGFDDLRAAVRDRIARGRITVTLDLAAGDGRTLALLSRHGTILEQHYEGDRCRVTASVPETLTKELAPHMVGEPSREDA